MRRPLVVPPAAVSIARKRATHFPAAFLLLALAVWLCHRMLFTSAIPAGTDLLGFVTRARQNASVGEFLSPWAPSSFGAVRQFTLDNILGALTVVTGNALWTVKLLVLTVLLATGIFAYTLSWHWYRNRVAAAFAGVFFMTSQASLTRWGSGELNVEAALACAPLLVLLWDRCLARPTARRLSAFTLVSSLVLYVRLDMLLYVAPFLGLQAVVRTTMAARPRAVLARLLRVALFVIPALCLSLAAQIVPIAAGIRAHWLSTATLFNVGEFAQRSLDAFPSLLGFGREIGYLAFTGQQTWYSHPWVPATAYEVCAALLVLGAVAALRWHRGHRALFLLAGVVVGVFLAKGVRGPLGGPYLLAVQHVPVFGNLRDPNRWLIVPSLSLAVLGGLTWARLSTIVEGRLPAGLSARVARGLGSAVLLCVLLLPVAPTLVRGYMTWRPQSGQLALLQPVAADRSQFTVASIPYDQTYRFLTQGGYRGYEHDLGAESAAFTGHPAIADGGWQQQSSDFVAFTSHLLARKDPAFDRLLGTVGVKYLVSFAYPETAPHLLPSAILSRPHDPATGTLLQQRAWESIAGRTPSVRNAAGATYRLPTASPPLSVRTNLAVVLGGRAGLAAFADLPGLHLGRWAVVTADDVLANGGLAKLVSLLRQADLVVVSNDRLSSLGVLAATPLFDVPGMTSNPDLDRLTELLGSDNSIRTGSLANVALAPAIPGVSRVGSSFRLPARRPVEVWARVETAPTSATLTFRLDGRVVRRVTPLALRAGSMIWVRVARRTLAPGTHSVGVAAGQSLFGDSYEVDEIRVVDARSRRAATHALLRAVSAATSRSIVALDTNALSIGLGNREFFRDSERVGSPTAAYWTILDPEHVHSKEIAPAGRARRALQLTMQADRAFYTIAQHNYVTARDWSGRSYLFLHYRGTGTGNTYRVFVDFDRDHVHSASYDVVDSGVGWQTVALSTRSPDQGTRPFTWAHVVSVRLASDSKKTRGVFDIGALALSAKVSSLHYAYPVPCGLSGRVRVDGEGVTASRVGCRLELVLTPGSLGAGTRVVEGPLHVAENPPATLSFRRDGPTAYSFSADAPAGGYLMFDQGFDRRWIMRASGSPEQPLPLYSLVNGYRLPPGRQSGTVVFAGTRWDEVGLAVAGAALVGLLAMLVWPVPRPTRERRPASRRRVRRRRRLSRPVRPTFWTWCLLAASLLVVSPRSVGAGLALVLAVLVVYRVTWWMCLVVASALLAIAPVIGAYSGGAANVAAVDVLALVGAGVVLLVSRERSRFAASD